MFLKDGRGKEKPKTKVRHVVDFLPLHGQFFNLEVADEVSIFNAG